MDQPIACTLGATQYKDRTRELDGAGRARAAIAAADRGR